MFMHEIDAFVFHLKMACIPLKVPDDHVRMHTHGFSFWEEKKWNLNLEIKKWIKRGKIWISHHQSTREVQCTEWCP